ncbi:MAG: response regulator transcription factor [Sinobacteraceae bacterium]|nr:response regulator transcription factor [Nevskiaceae bacterium]MBV9911128.1 response regulator transcription factor [Nevskiaceae bacterium]
MQRTRPSPIAHRKHTVLLIDEEGLLRDALCTLIDREENYTVVGTGTAAQILSGHPTSAAPEIVVMEFGLGELRGPETVQALRTRWPEARILVLTQRREDPIIEAALRAGVDGYLLKTDSRIEFLHALGAVLEGTRYISPAIFDRVVSGYVRKHVQTDGLGDGLSQRERAVMKRIGQGLRTREIAAELSLSYKTIEKHRSTLMRKLGLRTATAVAAYAIANGYLHDEID